jgi:hypothetical protein
MLALVIHMPNIATSLGGTHALLQTKKLIQQIYMTNYTTVLRVLLTHTHVALNECCGLVSTTF